MNRLKKKLSFIVVCILCSNLLAGCTAGKVYVDEDGNRRFMLVGETGPSGIIVETESETLEEETKSETLEGETKSETLEDETESVELAEEADAMQHRDDDSGNITGTSLKKGWTSTNNTILKGIDVSVKDDTVLFSINLKQDKEITISYDIILDEGEYSLVYIGPESEEQVLLQDDKNIHIEEKLLFTQGQNQIIIQSDNAVFKRINISIMGIEVSDFE